MARELTSCQVIEKTAGHLIKQVADDCGIKPVTLYKWSEPFEGDDASGLENPLHKVNKLIEAAKSNYGDGRHTLPIEWLAEKQGLIVTKSPAGKTDIVGLQERYTELTSEIGKLLTEYALAIEDKKIVQDEVKRLVKAGHQLQAATTTFMHAVEGAVEE